MRVLILSLDRSVLENGSSVQSRLIALAEAAGEITVLVPAEHSERRTLSLHLTVVAFGGWKPVQFLKLYRQARKELAARRYDLITVQDISFLAFAAFLLSWRWRMPLEVQVHGLEVFSGLRKGLSRFILERADKVRVVSKRLKESIAISYKLKADSLYVLPVYTQIETPKGIARRKTLPVPFTFLTIGRLVPVKNIAMQIRAFARLAKRTPYVRLRIVGDGALRKSLQFQVESLKLSGKVVFEGYQSEVGRYYADADAFLFTSDSEGWGRVALEAAAYHRPVIMTNVGLAGEVLKNEESALIIPVGNEYELTRALEDIVGSPELRHRLGEGAYRAFRALQSAEESVRKQIEFWRSFI